MGGVLRRLAKPVASAAMSAFIFNPPPKVLVNTLPKSGTHLLRNLMGSLPRMFNARRSIFTSDVIGVTQRNFPTSGDLPAADRERCRASLGRVRDGQFTHAHLPVIPGLAEILHEYGFRHVLLLRDPRDELISMAHFAMRKDRNGPMDRYLMDTCGSFEERLMTLIRGTYGVPDSPNIMPISRRMDIYGAWRARTDVLECRFERLIGSLGGGSTTEQLREIQRVAEFVDRPLSDDEAARLSPKLWSERSPTFRSGMIGNWREVFTSEHVAAFKEVAGSRLIEWGYEQDDGW